MSNVEKQRKTIEWKTLRSLQENQRYQGNISCKDGYDNRNSEDLTETEKYQESLEKLYKKCLNDPDNHDNVVTHLRKH